jgi:hypothetical protein
MRSNPPPPLETIRTSVRRGARRVGNKALDIVFGKEEEFYLVPSGARSEGAPVGAEVPAEPDSPQTSVAEAQADVTTVFGEVARASLENPNDYWGRRP